MMSVCHRAAVSAVVAGVLILAACQSYPSVPVPARMLAEKTQAQCIDQMQNAVQRPGGNRAVLTRAAFATEDRLTIVPSQSVLDAAGQPADGRMQGVPDSFRLTLNNGVCTLVREVDAMATSLPACTCVAIQKP